jgi:hypothetical protein
LASQGVRNRHDDYANSDHEDHEDNEDNEDHDDYEGHEDCKDHEDHEDQNENNNDTAGSIMTRRWTTIDTKWTMKDVDGHDDNW